MANKSFFKLIIVCVMLFFTGSLMAQQITVTGTVTDGTTNETIIGASVVEEGTTNGVITDMNGNYSIRVNGNANLVFSYIGYKTSQVSVGNRTIVNVTLEEDVFKLEEVVAIGYGTTRKTDLSTAISTVKLDQSMKSRPANINSMLQGQLPGVTIQVTGGDPLKDPTINIRGKGSRDNDGILWVVDGVPGAPYNVEDIESVTVLKDAASAAIYGASVGSGGVIVITTKQAQAGKVKVDVNISHSFQSPWRLPDVLTAEQYNMVWQDAVTNASSSASLPIVADPSRYAYGNTTRTDWLDEVFRTGHLQHYAVSLTGGSETIKAFGSFSYDKNDGVLLNTYREQMGAKLNVDFQIAKWLKFSQRASFEYTNGQGDINTTSHEGVLIGAIFYPRSATVYEYDNNGNPVLDSYGNQVYGGTIPQWAVDQGVSGYGEIRNPVATLNRLNQHRPSAKIFSTSSVEIKPISRLTLRSDFTAALRPARFEDFSPKVTEYGRPSAENSRTIEDWWRNNWLWESTATYAEAFGDHHISAMAGYTMQYDNYRRSKTYTYDYARENPHYTIFTNAGDWNKTKPEEEIWEESMMSVFGRIGYSYADRYFVTASLRRDATSKLAPENNSGVFPAVSASWKLSSESFFNVDFVNLLKLRGSWGQIGNKELVPRYSYNAPLGVTPYPAIMGANLDQQIYGTYLKTIANRSLKWETTEQTGFGLDANLFNNSLSLTVDYFYKTTKNLIDQLPVASTAGIETEPYGNVGKVVNKGWEFSANYMKTIGDVSLNVFGNLSTVTSEVKDLSPRDVLEHGTTINSLRPLRSTVGQPWYSYALIRTDGLFQSQEEIDNYVYTNPTTGATSKIQPNAKPGDLKYMDTNNDGIINDSDREYMGSYLPKVTYAFGGNFEYKGFDFGFMFQGVAGVKIFNGFKLMGMTGRQQGNNMLSDIMDSWTYNKSSNVPRLTMVEDANGNYSTVSDYFLESGSYLRLKNVTLGYTLPKSLMQNMGMDGSRIRVYLGAENLFTITPYNGFDPEVGNYGVDGGAYPVSRSFSVGLNLNF